MRHNHLGITAAAVMAMAAMAAADSNFEIDSDPALTTSKKQRKRAAATTSVVIPNDLPKSRQVLRREARQAQKAATRPGPNVKKRTIYD